MNTTGAQVQPLSRGFIAGWSAFCVLMVLVGVQEQLFNGLAGLGWRVADEVMAMAVASAIAIHRWRAGPRFDGLLEQPARWFAQALRWLPLAALGFVAVLYGWRHAMRALFGLSYEHAAWPAIIGYESFKFAVFYGLFTAVQFGLRSRHALAAERLRAERLQRLAADARLAQLTQQMQPHFLFNALNTIASLVHSDAAAADAALVRLSTLLRAATDAAARPQHALADELRLARAYAELMTQRYGDRVQLRWHDDASAATCPVPALALQTLIENCFVHAVEKRRATTHIDIGLLRVGNQLQITVADDGGMLASDWRPGVGIANLRERLHALHGAAATLELEANSGSVLARLTLPCPGTTEGTRAA